MNFRLMPLAALRNLAQAVYQELVARTPVKTQVTLLKEMSESVEHRHRFGGVDYDFSVRHYAGYPEWRCYGTLIIDGFAHYRLSHNCTTKAEAKEQVAATFMQLIQVVFEGKNRAIAAAAAAQGRRPLRVYLRANRNSKREREEEKYSDATDDWDNLSTDAKRQRLDAKLQEYADERVRLREAREERHHIAGCEVCRAEQEASGTDA